MGREVFKTSLNLAFSHSTCALHMAVMSSGGVPLQSHSAAASVGPGVGGVSFAGSTGPGGGNSVGVGVSGGVGSGAGGAGVGVGGSDKLPSLLIERPKMPRATWDALRNHILRERQRKKQEQEQSEEASHFQLRSSTR